MPEKNQVQAAQDDSVVRSSFKLLKKVTEEYTDPQLDFIIKNIAPTLNRDECRLMILKCEKLGLDPMSGDLTAYVSKDEKGNRKLTMIVARNFKREKALETGNIEWFTVEPIYVKKVKMEASEDFTTIQVQPWDGDLWGAKATIKKLNQEKLIEHTVKLTEYRRSTPVWNKAQTMICKVAESQAWDIAVPKLAAVYDESEQWDSAPIAAAVVPGGSEVATVDQLKTLEKLGADMERTYTKQEAVDETLRLMKEKRAQKPSEGGLKKEDSDKTSPAPQVENAEKPSETVPAEPVVEGKE